MSDEFIANTGTKVDDYLRIRKSTEFAWDKDHPVSVSGNLAPLFPEESFESNHEVEDLLRRNLPESIRSKTIFDSEYSCFFAYTNSIASARRIAKAIVKAIPEAWAEEARRRLEVGV